MTMVSKTALGIAAGICGTVFIGYCLYFDSQRRKDPNFKKKLRERRKAAKNSSSTHAGKTPLPDLKDSEAVSKFFIQEVKTGEESLGRGEVAEAVEHLCNAIAVCGQPSNLLQVLQQTIPPEVYRMILFRLPEVSQNIIQQQSMNMNSPSMDPE
ncbi:unnamed protein product [Bemisia tabaci]|uniref:Mitochondrial import receptor subunit TOM20 n=1 Tax=Bemisia tabaci TaxID=7038 RepID=A0A9P0F9C4_BEMTA|nr:unnamed protein product [Bemisia tabaci]